MSTDLFCLDDAFSVVTGASGWLGSVMVETLAEAGSAVLAVARRPEGLEAVAAPLRERGLEVEVLAVDVTSEEWPRALEARVADRGRLDVLVNNAHVGRGGSLRTTSPADFDEAFRLAVTAAWAGTEAGRPGLLASVAAGGSASVVNIASMYGVVAPDLAVYASEEGRNPPFYGAAKAALLQLTRYAAAELGPDGIRVNAITPGPFPGPAAKADTAFTDSLAAHTMLGRVGEPDDLRTALLFLASRHTRFVTGATIAVDGGWTAR